MLICGGSRVYGVPRPSSDLDVVVQITPADLSLLRAVADAEKGPAHEDPNVWSLTFGRLNVIVCLTEASYNVYALGIQALKSRVARSGVKASRAEAAGLFHHLQALLRGIREQGGSAR